MAICRGVNYSKYGIRLKLAIVALLIFLVWDVDLGLFEGMFGLFLGQTPHPGATSGNLYEWYFRSTLDHWSTFFGMIFALNYPITSLFYRKLEAKPFIWQWVGKGAVGAALLAAFIAWVLGPFSQPKLEYNATNAYFGFIPLITFVYFRNLTPTLRSYSLDLLHQIGKTTLETYLMQHHIWLTSDAKSLLTLIPGWPKVNMLVVTIIYYYVSRRLYKLTLFLRGMLLPDNLTKCIRSLVAMFAIILVFVVIAIVLEAMEMLSLSMMAIVSVVTGLLLYQTVVDSTWRLHASDVRSSDASDTDSILSGMTLSKPEKLSTIGSSSPPIVAGIVVMILGLTWHGMAQIGGTKILPLPPGCEAFVNNGMWIPVDGCNEESRGAAFRDYGVSAYATCSNTGTFVWGWNDTQPFTHCRFNQRNQKALKKLLNHRDIVFVGDSMTRHVYHATNRALGVADAGAYKTTINKQSDMNNEIGNIKLQFQWAALAIDQKGKLQDILALSDQGRSQTKPDVVVVGGGAWDRLHVYNTDEERNSHAKIVNDLATTIRLLKKAGIPVVWVVPTTINSDALSEEKRAKMNENEMANMRVVYQTKGVVPAASFVLDGPSYTKDRVKESYDGVHYPLSVYDAGAQILFNAFDWLLPEKDTSDPFQPKKIGLMANPYLGMMMLSFVLIGLVFFDGFMGFFYLASIFVSGVMPNDLYEEAFSALHKKMKLPAIETSSSSRAKSSSATVASRSTMDDARSLASSINGQSERSSVDEEIAALLGTSPKDLEMSLSK